MHLNVEKFNVSDPLEILCQNLCVETPLLMFGKCIIEIFSNCIDKRTFITFHVIDAATSSILSKSSSELLCVLSVLESTRYPQIFALTNPNFKYRQSKINHMNIKTFLKAQVLWKISNLIFRCWNLIPTCSKTKEVTISHENSSWE